MQVNDLRPTVDASGDLSFRRVDVSAKAEPKRRKNEGGGGKQKVRGREAVAPR